jgi:undecaprenyl-diphosphatase
MWGGYLEGFRSTDLVAINLIVYGLLLGAADRFGRQVKTYEDLSIRDGSSSASPRRWR